jgi:D-galactarolactone cycloisomerase
MRVATAEVIHVRAVLATPAGPAGVFNRHRESLLLKVTADDGTVGWGETYALPGTRQILTSLAEALVGAPLTRAWPRPPGLDEVGASLAISAIDIAWHDLLGRWLGVPVHTLLGGARRTRVPVYASGFLYREGYGVEEVWPDEAQHALSQGFRALKLRIGAGDPATEMAALARLRDRLPADVRLMVDAWGAYSVPTALRVGRRLAELDVAWFEEPTRSSLDGLAGRVDLPVAGGEMGRCLEDFRYLLDRGVLDVIQPDVSICGGLGTIAFVAQLAALHGVACVPHTWNGAVMAAATLHVLAALPAVTRTGDTDGSPPLEYDTSENPFMREVLVDQPTIVDGYMAVPDTPGLGIELDEATLRRFATE